jgi:signal transduction histidine kinase
MIEISVEDTGTGIKAEDKNKLFKLFGFLEETKELNTKGVGLGLHISQQISQLLGGEIVVDSEFGKGSTFTFVVDLEEH